MAKIILALCLLIGLTGCSSNISAQNRIEEMVLKEETTVYNARVNTVGDYFSYYLPADCYRRQGDNLSALIDYSSGHIVLNLNIKDIIANRYYYENLLSDDGLFSDEDLVYSRSSEMIKKEDEKLRYDLYVYALDKQYLIHLQTKQLQIYGYSYSGELIETIRHMMIIAKNTEVMNDKVIDSFSAKDVIDYEKKQVNLFNYVIPSSGYVQELLKGYEEGNLK
ncbi:MAG: hypothetical protein ACI4WM_02630 [Erysipelotrichaceae bacterium]